MTNRDAQKNQQQQNHHTKGPLSTLGFPQYHLPFSFSFTFPSPSLPIFSASRSLSMATTSDDGDRTCPLCTEEMDLTDQQLKPCKCGYEICVWCWHHIMDMAEKDDTEGRCPACRMPYDKEKIVGMAASCERMVAEISSERRKSQKSKSKASEGRKHLSSVRVIQRNLVYVIGLPNNLADEAILERKEYFGQYGKVLKVSITRPASGSQPPSNTNTCSVYITYAKEEEAVRCIQSVHGFTLEGKPLRACFGTTKYCHTWLRNMPCNNPDCLYLHDLGTPEDSFTKDEIISAYTRSRVQQMTGAANNAQRRSGNLLPPPADDFCSNSSTPSGKLTVKSATSNAPNQVKGAPNLAISGRSSVLPAAASWGLRVSNCRQPAASMACLQGPAKQKTDTLTSSSAFPSITATASVTNDFHTIGGKTSALTENIGQLHLSGRPGLEFTKYVGCQRTPDEEAEDVLDSNQSNMADREDKDRGVTKTPKVTHSEDLDAQQCSFNSEHAHGCVAIDETVHGISSQVTSLDLENDIVIEHSDRSRQCSPIFDHFSTRLDSNAVGGSRQHPGHGIDAHEPLNSVPLKEAIVASEDLYVSGELPNRVPELQAPLLSATGCEMDEVLLPVDGQRLIFSEAATYPSYLPYSCNSLKTTHLSSGYSSQHSDISNTNILGTADLGSFDTKVDSLLQFGGSVTSNEYDKRKVSSYELGYGIEHSDMISNNGIVRHLERSNGNASEVDKRSALDLGESSIISNILSLDLDTWDDSLTSPQSLAKLLGETEKQNGSLKLSSSWKPQNSSQSRFSFARQEDFSNQRQHLEPLSNGGHMQKYFSLQDSAESRDSDREGFGNGFTVNGLDLPVNGLDFPENLHLNSQVPLNKGALSRAQISAPPGFSVPSRAPPPGFSSQERIDRTFGLASSGDQLLESPLLRKQHQEPSVGSIGGSFSDIEFIDPAILAVGKGTLPLQTSNPGLDLASTLSAQLSASERDSQLRLLMQQSFSTHQNFRYADHFADQFSPLNDSYPSSRLLEQTQGNNLSHFAQMSLPESRSSHNQWDGWNGVQSGNDLLVSEIVRNERLGFNKYFPGHEELKFHMHSSGDLYNRAFGM